MSSVCHPERDGVRQNEVSLLTDVLSIFESIFGFRGDKYAVAPFRFCEARVKFLVCGLGISHGFFLCLIFQVAKQMDYLNISS